MRLGQSFVVRSLGNTCLCCFLRFFGTGLIHFTTTDSHVSQYGQFIRLNL